ncbi:class I SAM-dependent methyltransferase [Fusobacterium sp. MFO224]|uniref:class I SAM-dependent methyltransferase n=1 Tax=Fusobacterium sp. MFO224 TaxID=3378070 RepID=UPI0038549E3F
MKVNEEKINLLIDDIFKNKKLVKCIFSNMKGNYPYTKVNIKPILIKNEFLYQFEEFQNNKAYHSNLNVEDTFKKLSLLIENFNQYMIFTKEKDIQILKNKKGFKIKETKNIKEDVSLEHNKDKNYILKEGEPIPFLIKLGVMGENGKIFKKSYDKFKQINKYLQFIDETVCEMQSKKLINNSIKAIDFGCGKSYLTFALHYYFQIKNNLDFKIIGLDLKEDVIKDCNDIASELNLKNIEFLTGDIKDFDKLKDVDLIFSLHACNNATDYSLLKAMELNAKAILAVPCCQHEFNEKISSNKNSAFYDNESIIGKHGILLEKFSSIATDAFRAQALELCGFKTQVIEFIDLANTPKNVLIRGIREKTTEASLNKKLKEYNIFKNFLGIEPILDTLLKPYFLTKETK